jgi:signal transduction histidine kinase
MIHDILTIALPLVAFVSILLFLPILFFSKFIFDDYNRLYKPFLLGLFSMLILDFSLLAHTEMHQGMYKVLEFLATLGIIVAMGLVVQKTASIYLLSEVNKKLEEEVSKKTKEIDGLYRIASALQFSQNAEEVFENLTKIAADLVGAQSSIITLYDKEEGVLRAQSPGYNVPKDLIKGWVVELKGDKPAVEIFKNNTYYLSNDAFNDPKLDQPFMKKYGLKNTVNVSFASKESAAVGNLSVFNKKEGFSEEDAQLLSLIGPQLAATIENIVLETKMKESHKTLEYAYKQLAQVDRLKDDILSNVSHELKTPITVIRGSLDIIEDSEDIEEIRELAKKANQKVAHQLEIIENLLCYSLPEKNEKKDLFTKFKLGDLIEDLVKELEAYIQDKKVTIHIDIPDGLYLFAEEEKIKKALKNVLDNAIKFNRSSGDVFIKSRKANGYVKIKVQDTGIGIPEQHREDVFLPLYQIDPTSTRSYGGTGMGLAAAKSCLEMHGGKISAEGLNGEGTRVTIQIPAN